MLTCSAASWLAYYSPDQITQKIAVRKAETLAKSRGDAFCADLIERALLKTAESAVFYDATDADSEAFASDEHTQAYMFIRDRTAFVTFRGTSSRGDAMANLDMRLACIADLVQADEATKGAEVHNGFQNQFRAIEPLITRDLRKLRTEYDNVVFTGHSLGGALAAIAATVYSVQFARGGKKEDACAAASCGHDAVGCYCYTFGAPRVGNAAFCRAHERNVNRERSWRVVDAKDVVPYVPLASRYLHVPGTTWVLGDTPSICSDALFIEEDEEDATTERSTRGSDDRESVSRPPSFVIGLCRLAKAIRVTDFRDPFAAHDVSNYTVKVFRALSDDIPSHTTDA